MRKALFLRKQKSAPEVGDEALSQNGLKPVLPNQQSKVNEVPGLEEHLALKR